MNDTQNHQTKSPWERLSSLLTEERRKRLQTIAAKRTRKISLVLQSIVDPHNTGACLRSAEALGIQNVHIIHSHQRQGRSSVAKGSQKWLELHHWSSNEEWLAHMRSTPVVLAGGMADGTVDLEQIPTDTPITLIFGNEHLGLDEFMRNQLDIEFRIPMVGMVESLNISVAAALSMYVTSQRFQKKWQEDYYISHSDQVSLLSDWVCRDISYAQKILDRDRLASEKKLLESTLPQ